MKPKYNFFKNTNYALQGLKDIIFNEKSFFIEICFLPFVIIFLYFIDLNLSHKLLMFCSFFLILICEAINAAIERCVDLVTLEYNEFAKKAKDAGSAAVFLSISLCVLIWICLLSSKYLN